MGLFGEVIAAANINGCNKVIDRYKEEYADQFDVLALLERVRKDILDVVSD